MGKQNAAEHTMSGRMKAYLAEDAADEAMPSGVVRDGIVYSVLISLIVPAPFNPRNAKKPDSDRDNPKGKHVQGLARSIAEIGQIYPLVLARRADGLFDLIDGHCRLSALKELGCESARAIIVSGEAATYYRHANSRSKRHSENEALLTWLQKPDALEPAIRSRFENMQKHIGRKAVRALADAGLTYATYKQARKVAKFCAHDEEPQFIRLVLSWFAKAGTTYWARTFMESAKSAISASAHLLRCVRETRTLEDSQREVF